MKLNYLIIAIFYVCVTFPGVAQSYIECVDSAEYYIKRERWNDAERMTISALKQKPANKINYQLWSNLGDIRTALEEYDGALQAFEIALTTVPAKERARILNNRAFTLLRIGKENEALKDIEESLALDSLQEWPLKMCGIINLNKQNYITAEKCFISLKNHFPDNPAAYEGLGKIEGTKGNNIKAVDYFRKSLELNQDENIWFYLILVNIESDKIPEAKEDLLIALKRYPRSGNLYLLRGLIHKKNYENEEALIDKKIASDFGADPHLIERFFPNNTK
ncbi:MAG: tetratricopeptide repeat protein [Muribaculaceae bacterium]|nr:tetratricopeptide repeat protein [Muribaculaceae bacterium]